MQTGASALLAAASVATLYGLVHFFDMFRREPSIAAEPQRIDFASDGQADLSTVRDASAPEPAVEEFPVALTSQPPASDFDEAEAESVVAIVAQSDGAAPTKATGKGSRRTAGAKRKSKVADLKPVEVVDVAEPETAEEVDVAEPETVEEVPHVHVAPLFEPDPYVRMPRQAFGRRGQI